jgi:hypothetical protein
MRLARPPSIIATGSHTDPPAHWPTRAVPLNVRPSFDDQRRRWSCGGSPAIAIRTRLEVDTPAARPSKEDTLVSRVNFLETAPGRTEDVARVVRELVHPGISGEPGYVGYIVLGDRHSGTALGVTLWETDEARASSDAKARTIRPRVEEERVERCATSGSTTSFSSTFGGTSANSCGRESVPAPRLGARCRVVANRRGGSGVKVASQGNEDGVRQGLGREFPGVPSSCDIAGRCPRPRPPVSSRHDLAVDPAAR